jgi:hypothetical protein
MVFCRHSAFPPIFLRPFGRAFVASNASRLPLERQYSRTNETEYDLQHKGGVWKRAGTLAPAGDQVESKPRRRHPPIARSVASALLTRASRHPKPQPQRSSGWVSGEVTHRPGQIKHAATDEAGRQGLVHAVAARKQRYLLVAPIRPQRVAAMVRPIVTSSERTADEFDHFCRNVFTLNGRPSIPVPATSLEGVAKKDGVSELSWQVDIIAAHSIRCRTKQR